MVAATSLGAVPFFFVELDPQWAGICNGMVAGVMLAVSFDLIQEGQGHAHGDSAAPVDGDLLALIDGDLFAPLGGDLFAQADRDLFASLGGDFRCTNVQSRGCTYGDQSISEASVAR
ncbi:hypothetical protein LWI29_005836 [Acer saccharum]|uniref:Uncharacterized protein n=1 Tax=Acer saccharum TaxID=4024 RepID=A0AA39SUQ0_ACESA|nr:hypothetical protein LWI29_005836 [Acer saccharum]